MRWNLAVSDLPTTWFNVVPHLEAPPQPPLHPGTRQPVGPDDLAPLFPMALIGQEVTDRTLRRHTRRSPRRPRACGGQPRWYGRSVSKKRSARLLASTTRTSRSPRRVPTSPTRRCHKRSTTRPKGCAEACHRDRRRAVGQCVVLRVGTIRPRVQGLHGAGVVRAKAVPAGADGDLGRQASSPARWTTPSTRDLWVRRSVTRCVTRWAVPTPTTRSARC